MTFFNVFAVGFGVFTFVIIYKVVRASIDSVSQASFQN